MAHKRDTMFSTEEARTRTVHDTKTERDSGHGVVRDHRYARGIDIFWDWCPEATERGAIMIKIGKETAVISAEQLQRYLRWV